jgi:hypothetical protein
MPAGDIGTTSRLAVRAASGSASVTPAPERVRAFLAGMKRCSYFMNKLSSTSQESQH